MAMGVSQAILLLLSLTSISADEFTNLNKCKHKYFANEALLKAIDKKCENAACEFECVAPEMGWLNKNSEIIKDEEQLTASLASSLYFTLDVARKYAKGFFIADCNRLLAHNDCISYQYFTQCAALAGCDFALGSLENPTRYTDFQYWIERNAHQEKIHEQQLEAVKEHETLDLEKCIGKNVFVEDSAGVDAMDRCDNSTCPYKCYSASLGWLKKDSNLIKDEITLTNSLKSTSFRNLQTARKYAKGFFKANCNRLVANDKGCKYYGYFYVCSVYAGCEFARNSHAKNLTRYSDAQFWIDRSYKSS